MILTGNVALETMGFKTFGFAGGRPDVWEPDADVYWGPETEWLGDERYTGDRELEKPLGAVQMGLIYVNPEGPNGNPDPLAAARDIRETFGRMAMNDEETVALIAGGHTFGKTHGAADPDQYVGPEPEGASIEQMGLGWKQSLQLGQARGRDHVRPGGHLDRHADPVGQRLLRQPLRPRVGADQEPRRRAPVAAGRRHQRGVGPGAERGSARSACRRCSRPTSRCARTRRTRRSRAASTRTRRSSPDAFARAWFKLTHRDMGPIQRYLGPEVPSETLIWQDPVPAGPAIDDADVAALKEQILASGLSVCELVSVAWASASTFRGSRQARRRQRRPHPPGAAALVGGQQPGAAREGARRARGHPGRLRQGRSRSPT